MITSKSRKYWLCFGLIAVFLVVDQIVKIWVKTHMMLGEEIPLIGDWCMLHFVENKGMAFGMAFGGDVGKLILTLFRFVASVALCIFLVHLIKKETRTTLLVSISLIIAGAVGNLIDCCFYGVIFSDNYYQVATLFPEGGTQGRFLYGAVVDMFYFPLIETMLPTWIPFWGGNRFEFFDAIFNVADSAITIGAILLIVDQLLSNKKDNEVEVDNVENEDVVENLQK